MSTDRPSCRVCHRSARPEHDPATGWPALCSAHYKLVREVIVEAAETPLHERLVGFGTPLGVVEDRALPTPLRCDRAPHTWTGLVGELCLWCVDSYVALLAVEREHVLGPLDRDPDDIRAREEAERRVDRLIHSVSIGLVTEDEARRLVAKWPLTIGGRS